MFWIPLAIGAAAGALADRKQPLRGAAIGGAMGAGGAALGGAASGGGLLSGAGAGAAGTAGTAGAATTAGGITAAPGLIGGTATSGAGMGGTLGALAPAGTAGTSAGLLSSASPYLKDAHNVLGAASMAKNLAGMDDAPQAAPSAGMGGAQQPTRVSDLGLTASQRRRRSILG